MYRRCPFDSLYHHLHILQWQIEPWQDQKKIETKRIAEALGIGVSVGVSYVSCRKPNLVGKRAGFAVSLHFTKIWRKGLGGLRNWVQKCGPEWVEFRESNEANLGSELRNALARF